MVLFALNHWRGKHPTVLSLVGVLIGLGIVIHLLFGALPHPLAYPLVILIIISAVAVLVWQITGTLRSVERTLKGGGDMILYWGCYGASLGAALVMAVDLASLVSSTTGANPPPEQQVVTLELEGDTILIEGFIEFRTNTALRALLEGPDTAYTKVRLNSDGGRIFAARAIANALITHDINTEVTGRCASACTLVFLAGKQRFLRDGSQIGFHQYLQTSGVQFLDTVEEQEKDRAYFKARGVTDGFISTMFQAAHQDIWFPDRATLVAAGIVTD